MVRWVICCVTTPYSTFLNGCLEGYFTGAKGLGQGNPISHYLFILIMESFSNMLDAQVLRSGFVFHPRCSEMRISHVIFADDLFVLSGATVSSLQFIKQALSASGMLQGLSLTSSRVSCLLHVLMMI